ncbi:hypothetical protein P280DRAFT_284433 [Massarina eburnea CBS 473.64]|uniref:Zn(2)-C6 fungal-type domain-containing protein n=1 Tax=Massarina eburnea CBS 473.64 TaxID=1395130 RepID=A0A6A6S1P5_9PLEO|nr:hypothetical protein P280DRAFT_284433 [Massarina eburnea CBS 473.64]
MASKQAACYNCRRSKIKCKRELGAAVCEKCLQSGMDCIIPGGFHIGRQKGVKNKRTGLEKAIHQVEEALRKSKADPIANDPTTEQLQQLLREAHAMTTPPLGDPTPLSRHVSIASTDVTAEPPLENEHLALDDAENPLQLLARASDLRLASPPSPDNPFTPSSTIHGSDNDSISDIHRFFLPMKATLDHGPNYDPIDLGLVTVEEADVLMVFFFERLAHTRWGLDPKIHTLPFIRSRSSFLFTSMLTASSLFISSTGAICKRLLVHRKYLAEQVMARRLRSVEIVLAFMVNVPWMHAGSHAGDDDAALYISTALSIALDLSLNKIIIPSRSFDQEFLRRVSKADCLDARKALIMDGFEDADPGSEWGQRLLRRRERVWIALFVLERGICLARGRSYCVPVTPLLRHCDRWPLNNLRDVQDGPLVSMAVLRRDLDGLFSAVRSRCDGYRVTDVGSDVAKEIESAIESFFNNWIATWTPSIGEGEQGTLPPYVEILVTHTRLSTYSGVINHPTAPLEVKRLFRASALSSALNVMRAAIQGEARLKSMPNNTVTMICFAACVALTLSAPAPSGNHSLAPSVRNLVEETAAVLERIGSTPNHRNGASVVFGKYLRELVRQAPDLPRALPPMPAPNYVSPTAPAVNSLFAPASDLLQSPSHPPYPPPTTWAESFQFSAMSDNEVIETVMNVGDFNSSLLDYPMQDANSFMWMDWINPLDAGFQ